MEKPNTIAYLLQHNHIVGLSLNATLPGVVLPEYLRTQEQVSLEIGLNLPRPIPDLWIDEHGIAGTLGFDNGGPFHCLIPWSAVRAAWGMDGRGMVWDDVPGPPQPAVQSVDGGGETTPRKRGHLRLC